MRFSSWTVALSLAAGSVDAFPARAVGLSADLSTDGLKEALGAIESLAGNLAVDPRKPIDVSGKHSFQAPSRTDQRGPCPGLNALANHGYISRSGITSFVEVSTAITQVMGMGPELALILGLMGTVWTGNPVSLNPGFSIGGPPDPSLGNLLGNLGGLLGKPRGLRGAHNWLESDASLTRNDFYVTDNASTMNMTLFKDIHDRADEHGVISMDLLAEQAARRWESSVSENPDFYYGPVTGIVSRNAGYMFLGRLLSNHSMERPEGVLTQDVFRNFFAVYKNDQGNLEYREGHETIPDNWYRRAINYGLVELNLDIVGWIVKQPVLGSIGGNTGKVNSFTGLDLHDITNGVLNTTTLLEGNNLMCFVLQVLKTFIPNSLSSILATLQGPVDLLADTLTAPIISLACPAWRDLTEGGEPLWDGIQRRYDGPRKAKSSL